jgi:hypothetical protein
MSLFSDKKINKLKKQIKKIKKERKNIVLNSVRNEIINMFKNAQLIILGIEMNIGKYQYKYEIYTIRFRSEPSNMNKLIVICIHDIEPLIILNGHAEHVEEWDDELTYHLDNISDYVRQTTDGTYYFDANNIRYSFKYNNNNNNTETLAILKPILDKIYLLYYETYKDYIKYPIHEYRCKVLLILMAQKYARKSMFKKLPKDVVILIAKKVWNDRKLKLLI